MIAMIICGAAEDRNIWTALVPQEPADVKFSLTQDAPLKKQPGILHLSNRWFLLRRLTRIGLGRNRYRFPRRQ